jgi:hypothetical protein
MVLLALANIDTQAQSEDKLGSWYIYNGFFKFTPKSELFFETQLRNYEVFSNPETFFLRPYYTYNINENLQPGISIEYHKSWTYAEDPADKVSSDEIRVTLQMMVFQKIGRSSLQHRYRYEFRNVNGDPLRRMRYRFQVTIPINSETMNKGTFFANTNAELMIDTSPNLGINQNRFFLAGGYQFTDNLNLQLGYLAVFRPSTVHHRVQFFVTHKLWFFDRE